MYTPETLSSSERIEAAAHNVLSAFDGFLAETTNDEAARVAFVRELHSMLMLVYLNDIVQN